MRLLLERDALQCMEFAHHIPNQVVALCMSLKHHCKRCPHLVINSQSTAIFSRDRAAAAAVIITKECIPLQEPMLLLRFRQSKAYPSAHDVHENWMLLHDTSRSCLQHPT
jgi:hypothetical protein